MAQYSLQQMTFVLSVLSNGAASKKGTVSELEQILSSSINAALTSSTFTQYIGTDWSVVWGPIVSQESGSSYADNAMYVAHSPSQNAYVVAIAGTNFLSKFDVEVEDADVTLVDYQGPAQIATGTLDGITALEAMSDPNQGTLLAFLNGLPDSTQLIFAGHSLGGALAPALVVDLILKQGLKNSFSNVMTFPTAGPTPGNSDYALLYQIMFFYQPPFPPWFPPGLGQLRTPKEEADASAPAWQTWNKVIWNSLDVVPHAWNQLAAIPTIYGDQLPADTCIQSLVTYATNCILGSNVFAQLPNVEVPGFFVLNNADGGTAQFVSEVVAQHIPQYFQMIVPELAGVLPSPGNDALIAASLFVKDFCIKHPNGQCQKTE
ncbi:MAG TPA: hypothetical protein VF618_27115 [Thermoanaerobaculia bacterium]